MSFKRKTIIQIVLSLIIILSAIVGSIQTISYGTTNNGNDLLYFTIQSNLWLACFHMIFLIYQIISLKKGVDVTPRVISTFKFIFVAAISLTFLVFFLFLVPELGAFVITIPGSILTHLVAPIIAIIEFIFFESKLKVNKKTSFYPIIAPLMYFIVIIILSYNGLTFIGNQKVPYFFLDYEKLGWFKITKSSIGVFYWVIILSVFVFLISFGLIKLNKFVQNKNNK